MTGSEKNSYRLEELEAAGVGDLFGQDAPRLPMPGFLMLDRVIRVSDTGGAFEKGEIIGELDIRPDLWFFQYHFQGDPVMPGNLELEALMQLAGFFMGWKGYKGRARALGAGEIRYSGEVLPTADKAVFQLDIRRVRTTPILLVVADGTVLCGDRVVATAKQIKVGVF